MEKISKLKGICTFQKKISLYKWKLYNCSIEYETNSFKILICQTVKMTKLLIHLLFVILQFHAGKLKMEIFITRHFSSGSPKKLVQRREIAERKLL